MKQQILSVRNPVWANSKKTLIDCLIRSSAYADEIPFTASPDDVEEHGREIFRRCVAGDFGGIGEFAGPSVDVERSDLGGGPSWVSAWPEVEDFIVEANAENARGTSRGVALVWGCMLETQLKSFVSAELQRQGRGRNSLKTSKGKSVKDNFNDWIDAAISERIIDSRLGNHLHAIRRIRNVCAHQWRLNAENPEVKALYDDFEVLRAAYFPEFLLGGFDDLIKMVYSAACAQIIMSFAETMCQSSTFRSGRMP